MARRRRSSSQSSQPAYPGVAVHYDATPLSYQQYRSSSSSLFDVMSNGTSSLSITDHDQAPTAPASSLFVHQNNFNNATNNDFMNNTNTNEEEEHEAQHQKYLQSNLVTLHNTILRNYHLHTISQYHKRITYLLFHLLPTTLLTLAGGVITFVATYEFSKPKDENLHRTFMISTCLSLLCATFWYAHTTYTKPWSQCILHHHLTAEYHKLANRCKHCYEEDHDYDFYNSLLQSDHQQPLQRKKLKFHDIQKFQVLYDQIQACYNQYTFCSIPSKYIAIYHALNVKIQTVLGSSLYDNHEVQWWLMPILYQYCMEIIFRHPLFHSPSWYVDQTISHFLKCFTRKDYSIKTTKKWVKQQESMIGSIMALQNARQRQQQQQNTMHLEEDEDVDEYEEYGTNVERIRGGRGGGGRGGEYSDYYTLEQEAATLTTAASSTLLDRSQATTPRSNVLSRDGENDVDKKDLSNASLLKKKEEGQQYDQWDDNNNAPSRNGKTDAGAALIVNGGKSVSHSSSSNDNTGLEEKKIGWKGISNMENEEGNDKNTASSLSKEDGRHDNGNDAIMNNAKKENTENVAAANNIRIFDQDSDDESEKILTLVRTDEEEEQSYDSPIILSNEEEKQDNMVVPNNTISSLHDADTAQPQNPQQVTTSLSPPRTTTATTATNSIHSDSEAIEYEEKGAVDDKHYDFEIKNKNSDESTTSEYDVSLLLPPAPEPSTLSNPTEVSFHGEDEEQQEQQQKDEHHNKLESTENVQSGEEEKKQSGGAPTSEPSNTSTNPSVISFGDNNSDDEEDDDDPMKRNYYGAAGGGFPSTMMMVSSTTTPYATTTMVGSRLSTIDSYTTSGDVSGSQSKGEI